MDAAALTVTVQPGMVWEKLERAALHRQGLTLAHSTPPAAPSSTVGGWLAQGGVGYGSFGYGPVR